MRKELLVIYSMVVLEAFATMGSSIVVAFNGLDRRVLGCIAAADSSHSCLAIRFSWGNEITRVGRDLVQLRASLFLSSFEGSSRRNFAIIKPPARIDRANFPRKFPSKSSLAIGILISGALSGNVCPCVYRTHRRGL